MINNIGEMPLEIYTDYITEKTNLEWDFSILLYTHIFGISDSRLDDDGDDGNTGEIGYGAGHPNHCLGNGQGYGYQHNQGLGSHYAYYAVYDKFCAKGSGTINYEH